MGGRTWLSLAITVMALFPLAACNSSSSANPTSSQAVPVSLAIHDTPPTGVSILSFEIQVTGASLVAQGSSSPVSLVNAPDEIELEHLQTSSAFLGNANVPAGTYTSMTVTFANPQMTILNNTGGTLTVGSTNCANGQICEVNPTLNKAAVTINSSPFPITLSSNSPLDFSLDFNLNSSVQGNLSITPTVTVTTITAGQEGSGDNEVEMTGLVTAVDSSNKSFTLQVGTNSQAYTILTDSNTEFNFEDQTCTAKDFTCIAANQILKVDARMNNNQLTANDVEEVAMPQSKEVTGTVVAVNSGQNQFEIVLQDIEDSQDSATLSLGLPVAVTVQAGATFNVSAGGLSLSPGASFIGFANMMVGQEVSVNVSGVQTSAGGIGVTTSQVTLDLSEVSGTVSSVNAGNDTFVLSQLPSLFTSNGITQILVTVGSSTQYENTTGIGALSANQSVSVSGLLEPDSSITSQGDMLAGTVKLRLD